MLNNLIQRGLEHRGLLGGEKIESEILVAKNLTKAELVDVPRYEVGDVVRFDQTYKRLRIDKDSYLTVKEVDRSNSVVVLDHDGRDVRWKPSVAWRVEAYANEPRALHVGDLIRWTRNDHANERINAEVGRVVAIDRAQHRADVLVNGTLHKLDLARQGHWELAYATTIHAAQGRTADRVLLHLDTSKPHLSAMKVGTSASRAPGPSSAPSRTASSDRPIRSEARCSRRARLERSIAMREVVARVRNMNRRSFRSPRRSRTLHESRSTSSLQQGNART